MLTRAQRLISSREFARAVRRGRRAGTRTVVLHLLLPAAFTSEPAGSGAEVRGDPVVGFVVSKAVGGAVVRNQVKRRLRHLARERLTSLPGSAVLVVRALPAAASATYAELGSDLDRALGRLLARSPEGPSTRRPDGRPA